MREICFADVSDNPQAPPDGDAPSTGEVLAQLIQRRHTDLRELLRLGREQAALVENDNIDGVLAVLERKAPHVQSLLYDSGALKQWQETASSGGDWPDAGRHAEAQRMWTECNAMYDEMIRLEQASMAVLCQRQESIGRQLDIGQQSREVHAAYLQGREPMAAHVGHLDLVEE